MSSRRKSSDALSRTCSAGYNSDGVNSSGELERLPVNHHDVGELWAKCPSQRVKIPLIRDKNGGTGGI